MIKRKGQAAWEQEERIQEKRIKKEEKMKTELEMFTMKLKIRKKKFV